MKKLVYRLMKMDYISVESGNPYSEECVANFLDYGEVKGFDLLQEHISLKLKEEKRYLGGSVGFEEVYPQYRVITEDAQYEVLTPDLKAALELVGRLTSDEFRRSTIEMVNDNGQYYAVRRPAPLDIKNKK